MEGQGHRGEEEALVPSHRSGSDSTFYHFSFLARNTAVPKVSGSIAAVIEPYLQRAREETVPAWVEATTKQAADIYAFYGFRLVEEIRVGQGQVDAAGWPLEGGEGVTAYALIYDAHLKD